jgi:MFS family permease
MPARSLLLDLGPLRSNTEFRRCFAGFGAAQLGVQIGTVAISLQVYEITRSNLDVGLISLVQLAPAFLGSIFGGSVADAFDRRKVLLATATAMTVCSVALALNALGYHPSRRGG